MPYFETGTEVPFTAADEVNLLTYALQGQHIGDLGIQRYPVAVDAPTQDMLNNFTTQNLTDIANFIASNASVNVEYMKMSWNLQGATITDLVIGLVATITAIPNNGQDIINAMMVQGPIQYLLDQVPMLFSAYIIGKPPVGTYHQKITTTIESEWGPYSSIISEYGSEQQAINILRNQIIADLQAKYVQKLAEQGITATVISVTVLNMQFLRNGDNCKLTMTMEVVIDSDTPIFEGNLPIPAIAWIILAIVLAITVPPSVAWVIVSMTTKTVTTEELEYGWVVNPVTGEAEWVVVRKTTKTETSPDYGGILMMAVGATILIGGLATVYLLLMKRNGRNKT